MKPCVASQPPGHVFMGSLAEIDPRKVAEVVHGSRHIRSLQYSAIGDRIADYNNNRLYYNNG